MPDRMLELEIDGVVERIDLDEIDALWARIQAGPGEDAGERLLAAFAGHAGCAIEAPREYEKDRAGMPGPEPLPVVPIPLAADLDDEDEV